MNEVNHPEGQTSPAMEDGLSYSEQILKAIFDSAKSSIFLISADYTIKYFNQWAKDGSKILYGRDLFIGDSMLNYRIANDDAMHQAFRENFEYAVSTKCRVVSESEMHFPLMNFWVRSEFTPVFDHDKLIGILLHVENISAQKKIQLQSSLQEKRLIDIAWSLSHETRQPVATLLGLISILNKKTLCQENLQIINMLEETAGKLEKIIQQSVILANEISMNGDA